MKLNIPELDGSQERITWTVEKVVVRASINDMEMVYAGPSAQRAIAWEVRQNVRTTLTDLIGSLYVGKRHVPSITNTFRDTEYSGHVTGLTYLPSAAAYGYTSVYYMAMVAAFGLGLGMFSGTLGAYAFGWFAVGLVGFALPTEGPMVLVPKLIPYSGVVRVPVTIEEAWYIDPTLQGNTTFDGLPVAPHYTRVVFDDGDVYLDPLERYDAYTKVQEY